MQVIPIRIGVVIIASIEGRVGFPFNGLAQSRYLTFLSRISRLQ